MGKIKQYKNDIKGNVKRYKNHFLFYKQPLCTRKRIYIRKRKTNMIQVKYEQIYILEIQGASRTSFVASKALRAPLIFHFKKCYSK